jgi:hypothetical protein
MSMVTPGPIGRRTLFLGLAALVAGSTAALAHHGWSGYGTEDFSLTGTVEAARLGNPHGLIKVAAEGGIWDVVLGPPSNQRRAGLTEADLPKGASITAEGHRHNDPKRLEMKTERLTVNGKRFDIYPSRL